MYSAGTLTKELEKNKQLINRELHSVPKKFIYNGRINNSSSSVDHLKEVEAMGAKLMKMTIHPTPATIIEKATTQHGNSLSKVTH